MKKNYLIIILILIVTSVAFAAEDKNKQGNIGYKFYSSKASTYYYISNYENKTGDIFIDWEDNLYIINSEGTSIYNPLGTLINHMNERIQIPLKADKVGNIFILKDNKIKKLSPQKELISSFSIDEDSRLINIDNKSNYHFLSTRKEYKTDEYNDEIIETEKELAELQKPVELPENGELNSIELKMLDYRDEKRDANWALELLKTEYDNYWKEYEFGTTSAEKNQIKVKVDDALAKIKKHQNRLKFIDKDIDFWKDRKREIISFRDDRIKDKQKENKDEIKRLREEKEELKKKISEDKKLKYEIRVYTSDKYLTDSYPVPLSQEGIPLFSCRIITSSENGNFYGSDGKSVYIYNWDGTLLSSFGSSGDHNGAIKAVSQLAVDNRGNIYVVDPINKKILKIGLTKPAINSIH